VKHVLAASMLVIGGWVASPAAQPQVTPVALPPTESSGSVLADLKGLAGLSI